MDDGTKFEVITSRTHAKKLDGLEPVLNKLADLYVETSCYTSTSCTWVNKLGDLDDETSH